MHFLLNPVIVKGDIDCYMRTYPKRKNQFSKDLTNQCFKKAHIRRVEMMLNDSS